MRVNGTDLNVVDIGDGAPALVFLHYWCGSSRTWAPVMERLSGARRCVAIDFRSTDPGRAGRLMSNPGPGDFASEVEAAYADIDAALRAQGLSAADVLHETIYTSDMRALVGANDKRLEYYRHVTLPACTWVEVRKPAHPAFCLHVEVTARRARPDRSPN